MPDDAQLKANMELAHKLHIGIITDNDHDLARRIVHDEFVVHGPGADPEKDPRGPDGAIKMAIDDNNMFPDGLTFEHFDTFAAGDKVAFRWVLRGRQRAGRGLGNGYHPHQGRKDSGSLAGLPWRTVALSVISKKGCPRGTPSCLPVN